MSAKILDGKACSEQTLEFINANLRDNDPPTLVIISVGDDPASKVYVRNKMRAAEKVGIKVNHMPFTEYADTPFIIDIIKQFNDDEEVDGIMVQLPLPSYLDERAIIDAIDPAKDVDGLTYMNMGMLHEQTCFHQPCTAKGIIWLLHENGIHLTGRHVVVVGRSEIVGKPVALLALNNDATVTICHSRTKNLAEMTRQADILIVAVGKPGLITADMVKPGAVVVDVGINRTENGLVGDVDFDGVKEVASWITPVPGGVGPMTVAMLMMNTFHAQGMNR